MRFIPYIFSVVVAFCGYFIQTKAKKQLADAQEAGGPTKKLKLLKALGSVLTIVGIWLLIGYLITLIFGSPEQHEFGADIFPPRSNITIFGYQPTETMLVGWGVMAVLIIGAVVLRIVFIPKLTDVPGKFQNAIETIIETVESYSAERVTYLGRPMYGYVFAIGMTLVGNAVAELMGFRSPSSDLMFTLALSIFVFLMANWYGIRALTLRGRIKSMASPPILLPIRLVTDIANPLSMACRLFGNTLSGMIIMSLLYSVLGNSATGIPSVLGLYFNVFTALIQMVIFITLTLANIKETTTLQET